jgi:hypothetical protein
MQPELGAGGFKFVVLLQKSSLGTVKDAESSGQFCQVRRDALHSKYLVNIYLSASFVSCSFETHVKWWANPGCVRARFHFHHRSSFILRSRPPAEDNVAGGARDRLASGTCLPPSQNPQPALLLCYKYAPWEPALNLPRFRRLSTPLLFFS